MRWVCDDHIKITDVPHSVSSLIYVTNIHRSILLFHLLFFGSLSSSASVHQLLRHTSTLLLLAFLHFCYYYWAFGLQHNSAFSWVCSLSINYRLQNRGNFSGAAYWISKRSAQWCHQRFETAHFNAAVLPRVAPYLWALPSQMTGVLLDCVLNWCLSQRWYYTRCSPRSLCR